MTVADTITIPTPNVPYGPQGVEPRLATADYLESVLRKVQAMEVEDDGDRPRRRIHIGGSNVTAAVERLLRDVAAALRAPAPVPQDATRARALALIDGWSTSWKNPKPWPATWDAVHNVIVQNSLRWLLDTVFSEEEMRRRDAAAWDRGFLAAYNSERGRPDDHPWPADRARELAEWNPYRDEQPREDM